MGPERTPGRTGGAGECRTPAAAELVEQAVKDADTFFGVELPGLTAWAFTAEQSAAIGQPVLSVRGTSALPLWVEVADFLRASCRTSRTA